MQPSGAQKILRILSIINIVGAALTLAMAGLLIFGGGYYAGNGTAVEGMTAAEAGAGIIFAGVATVIDGIISLVVGILGLRAAKDNSKIMPVWILAVLGLISGVIGLAMTVLGGSADASAIGAGIGDVVGSALIFWLANIVKREAGR